MADQPDSPFLSQLAKGRPLPSESAEALAQVLGVPAGLEGLSQLFEPGFPGVRSFAVDVHATPSRVVQLQMVGIARNGRPIWTGSRSFALGRDGSLEIHRGFDEVDPEYRSRNFTVDLIQKEIFLLDQLRRGDHDRITADAELDGRLLYAVHGFVFADETEQGPPICSNRLFDPTSDRKALAEEVAKETERIAERQGLGRIAVEAILQEIHTATTPLNFATLAVTDQASKLIGTDEGDLGLGDLGRELLLASSTPPWRAALYRNATEEPCFQFGAEYRRRKTARSQSRLDEEIDTATKDLGHSTRAARVRALKTLGMVAPTKLLPKLRELTKDADRRVAAVARQTIQQISGSDLAERMMAYAYDPKGEPRLQALSLRVLAEHFPDHLTSRISMLRVHPDARFQRAVVPLVARGHDHAEGLASMLTANPYHPDTQHRPGLIALRIELIDRLRTRADPRTLPCLMEAFRATPAPPPAEQLALSRALVVFADPRAQTVLVEVANRLPRVEIP